MTTPPTRLRGIDALRGAAAMGVVVYHAVEKGQNVLPNNLLQYPVRLVQFASSFGYIGVTLVYLDQPDVVTTGERGGGDDSRDDNFCVAVFLVLREAVYDGKTSATGYTDYTDPSGRICVIRG